MKRNKNCHPLTRNFGLAAAQPAWRVIFRSTAQNDLLWLVHLLHDHNEPFRYDTQARAADKNRHLRQAATLVSLMEFANADFGGLIELLYSQDDRYGSYGLSDIRRELEGFDAVLTQHADTALSSFPKLQPHGRIAFIEDLSRLGLARRPPFLALVWSHAVSASKTMSKPARAALASMPADDLVALAETTFASGDGATRRSAAEALAQLAGTAARPALRAQAKAEKTKGARDAIAALVAQIDSVQTAGVDAVQPAIGAGSGPSAADRGTVLRAIDRTDIVIPPIPALPPDTPLPEEALEPLRAAIPAYNAAVRDQNAKIAAHNQAQGYTHPARQIPEIEADIAIPRFHAVLHGDVASERDFFTNMARDVPWVPKEVRAAYKALVARPDVTLWHLLRLMGRGTPRAVCGIVFSYYSSANEEEIAARCKRIEDVRVPIAIAERLGSARGGLVRDALMEWGPALRADETPSLAFHVYEHLDLVEEALGLRPKSGQRELAAEAALRLLGDLPKVPEQFRRPLLDLAVGSRKTLHKPARALLETAVGIEAAILVRLADPKKEVRWAAATWLGERGQASAVPHLEKALKKEKSEEGRAAMLTALSRLGIDISEHLSEKALKSEAVKGLERTATKSLDWFPFDTVPALKWSTGKKVDPTIVKWWIVLADKLKSPSGNALFDFYLDRLRPEDAGQLGLFMLSTFVARDTISPSEADARTYAKKYADERQRYWQRWCASHPQHTYPFDYQQTFDYGRLAKLSQHLHSAAEHRGILGLASRAPGADAAALVRRYLKDNGSKVSQAKSLLAALSANPAPAAIQAVLAAANRLKQKSVQAYAAELVQAIAERRGWSRDELADRTIPTAGLDEAGELELPCGPGRTFKAIYHGEGRIELLNPAGKPAKALPDPRGDVAQEKEEVAASKKALSAARKEVKQVERMQAERLYEAMCVGRSWPVEVWRSELSDHPIVGRLCRRLVWLGLDAEGRTVATFRPLGDGTLTGNDDEPVEIGTLTSVTVAHQALMPENDAKAWETHLRDYEVRPLFQQLGRPLLKAGSDMAEATEVDDRKGWMIDNFKMANAASKLGYERGGAEDGGHVSTYAKRFAGAQLSAVIQFSGHYIAESKQVPCALISASFMPISDRGGFLHPLALGKVAPVLLSEVWSDLHAIAAAGSGFDKDWQKKVGY